MMKYLIFSLIWSYFSYTALGRHVWSKSAEDKVAETFLKSLANSKYDFRISPEGRTGPGTPIEVAVSMYFLDISKVNDYSMDFNAQFYFRQSWNDSRLQFKDSDVTTVTLRDVDSIWTPDLFFVQEREGSQHDVVHPNIFCKINSAGEILYSVRLSIVFSCPMDLRKYPHDVQKCSISIESYGFQRAEIDLKWFKGTFNAVMAAPELTLSEFEVVDISKSVEEISFSSGNYSRLQVDLTFKRKSGFFVLKLYIPFVILVLLSWLSLWISSSERCLRFILILVILYLMITISYEVSFSSTATPYAKASDVWIGFCESMVFAAFLELILVCLTYEKETDGDCTDGKAEIPALETSKQGLTPDSTKLSKLMNLIDARNPARGRANILSFRIDRISRIIFPFIFIIFNIVYWAIFCSA